MAINPVVELVLDTLKQNKQALVFAESKKSAEKAAEDIALSLKKRDTELDELALKIVKSLAAPTTQCARLAACVKKGIAFHHAGLLAKQRTLIEDAYRAGLIKAICSTPTLAYGVDTPAFRVVIKSLKRYDESWGMSWISALDYQQMCGRAGRPTFHDTYGEAVIIAKSEGEQDELYYRYVIAEPEAIESKLAVEPVLRIHVLSLIATGFVRSREQLLDFFSATFWAHQYKDIAALGTILDKVVHSLEEWAFLSMKNDDFVRASDLGAFGMMLPTILGQRVAELYIDPYTAHQLIKGLLKAHKTVTPFALVHLICNTTEMRPLLRTGSKEQEKVQGGLLEHYSELIHAEPSVYDPSYDDFIDSIKTTMFLMDWADEKDEEELLGMYAIRPGEIRTKLEKGDWLFYALEELAPLLRLHELLKVIKKVRLRVKFGVREELLTLLRLEGVGRVRARRLHNSGLKDIGDVKSADIGAVARLIGQKTALRVKKQLGQEVKEIPVTKRKGQMNLGKF